MNIFSFEVSLLLATVLFFLRTRRRTWFVFGFLKEKTQTFLLVSLRVGPEAMGSPWRTSRRLFSRKGRLLSFVKTLWKSCFKEMVRWLCYVCWMCFSACFMLFALFGAPGRCHLVSLDDPHRSSLANGLF